MTYDTLARTRRRSRPIELYMFRFGSGPADYYACTEGATPITVAGVTYNPLPVQRDNVSASGSLDKQTLSVKVPAGSDPAELFRVFPPAGVVTLIITQGFVGDPDTEFLVVWSGRVLSAQWENSEVTLTCEPILTQLQRPGLRRNYQIGCPLPLYSVGDGLCNASKAAATTAAVVSAISGPTITLTTGFVTDNHRGGIVEWDRPDGVHEIRTILSVPGANQVRIAGTIRGLSAGSAISVVLGCNHKESGCTLHSNINNYGGQSKIPIKNPFGQYNNFY